jgi:serine/threonine protein kinase
MKVQEEIARGGFGRVDLVELPDGSRVARKTFDPFVRGISQDEVEKMRRRFVREVNIQRSLNSPSFTPVLDFDLTGDNPWFCMPMADKSFAEEIAEARQSGSSLEDALADILNALEELHELGFVHRDLKPQNILRIDGRWCLTDFGLVMPPSGTTTKITSYASNWGTAAYCAPEQAVEFRNASAAVDIYAYGCILHDIYGAGPRIPYQKQTTDGQIGLIIEKCTEQNPGRRFRSVRALRGVLLSHLATPPDTSPSQTAQEWKAALESADDWDQAKFEEFAQYVRRATRGDDVFVVFYDLSEDTIHTLRSKDADLWKTVALRYCQWAEETGPWRPPKFPQLWPLENPPSLS